MCPVFGAGMNIRIHLVHRNRDAVQSCRREIEMINARIGTAYLELTEKDQAQPSTVKSTGTVQRIRSKEEIEEEKAAAKQQAKELISRARDAEVARDFHTAIQYVELALRQDPEVADYHAFHASLLQRNPAWSQRAEAAYIKALELDPDNPDTRWDLAQLYLKGNLKSRAKEQLEHVAELDADRAAEIKKLLKQLK